MVKRITKLIITIVLIPVLYLLVSLILTFIPVKGDTDNAEENKSIYLNSNGIHLNIIIPRDQIEPNLLAELNYDADDHYFSFGWGDKHFYLETPTWVDLSAKNAFRALFLKSPSLIHLTRYSTTKKDWVEIKVNQSQLNRIQQYIGDTFYYDPLDKKIILKDKGYSNNDDFFKAMGSYFFFNTCNSWVNTGLKRSNIKASLWTPFDFGLLNMHKK